MSNKYYVVFKENFKDMKASLWFKINTNLLSSMFSIHWVKNQVVWLCIVEAMLSQTHAFRRWCMLVSRKSRVQTRHNGTLACFEPFLKEIQASSFNLANIKVLLLHYLFLLSTRLVRVMSYRWRYVCIKLASKTCLTWHGRSM